MMLSTLHGRSVDKRHYAIYQKGDTAKTPKAGFSETVIHYFVWSYIGITLLVFERNKFYKFPFYFIDIDDLLVVQI